MKLRHRHKQAARTVGPGGFVQIMTRHVAFFTRRGTTLVVGFDNMKSREMPAPACPWGYDAIAAAGHSHLGICMSRRNDWFRHGDLAMMFDRLRRRRFFDQFERVVFYGASMGGYGALAYCAACPGADVFVFSPQTTLDPVRAPFETRYRSGFARGDWTGAYVDGAESARAARQITVIADPYELRDMAHIRRLPPDRLVFLPCPNFGHAPARLLKHMHILGEVTRAGWEGHLTPERFAALRRSGRASGQTLARRVLQKAVARGHSGLVRGALEQLAESRPDWCFPRVRAALAQADPSVLMAAE